MPHKQASALRQHPDHAAFIQAIVQSPDDDSLRRVYADWLEEHGDTDRAKFIRLQINLASLPDGDIRRRKLTPTISTLLRKYRNLWLGPLAEWNRLVKYEWKFQRGFVETASLFADDARRLAHQLEVVFREAPTIRELKLVNFRQPDLTALTQCPSLAHLKRLVLRVLFHFSPQDARALGGNPLLANLTALVLEVAGLDSAGIEALLEKPSFERLESFNLAANNLGDAGAAVLASSPALRHLKTLVLDSNNIGSAGAEALANSSYLGGVKTLFFRYNRIGPKQRAFLRTRFGIGFKG